MSINDKKKNVRDFAPGLLYALVAFALAVFLWLYINGSSIDLITKDFNDIPITITGEETLSEKGLYYTESAVKHYVNLRLRGTEQNLRNIDPSSLSATVDFSEINSTGTSNLTIVLKGMPNSLILEDMKPASLSVHIEEFTEREMSIKVITNGKPAEGFTLQSARTDQKATLTGDSGQLGKVDHLEALVSINGLNASSEQEAEVKAYDANGNPVEGIEIRPEKITVSIAILKKP